MNQFENHILRTPYFTLGFGPILIIMGGGLYLFITQMINNGSADNDLFQKSLIAFAALVLLGLILLIYSGVIIILENKPENQIKLNTAITSKHIWAIPKAFGRLKYYINIKDKQIFGYEVDKEIYNAVSGGSIVEVTLYKYSKNLKGLSVKN